MDIAVRVTLPTLGTNWVFFFFFARSEIQHLHFVLYIISVKKVNLTRNDNEAAFDHMKMQQMFNMRDS